MLPKHWTIWGSIHYSQWNTGEAMRHLEQATGTKPDRVIINNLAELYERSDRMIDSLLTYRKIIERYLEDMETLNALGDICRKLERKKVAGIFYQWVSEINPRSYEARQSLKSLGLWGTSAQVSGQNRVAWHANSQNLP